MRYALGVGIAVWIALHAGIGLAQGLQNNMDRPGGGGWSVPNINTPQHCQQLCNREGRCRAFTWVRPGLQGSGGRCWLKESVTPLARNNCCVSGLKASQQATRQCKWFQRGSSYECKCFDSRVRRWNLMNPDQCPKNKPSVRYLDPNTGGWEEESGGSCPFGQC